jgi:hypothetical protein
VHSEASTSRFSHPPPHTHCPARPPQPSAPPPEAIAALHRIQGFLLRPESHQAPPADCDGASIVSALASLPAGAHRALFLFSCLRRARHPTPPGRPPLAPSCTYPPSPRPPTQPTHPRPRPSFTTANPRSSPCRCPSLPLQRARSSPSWGASAAVRGAGGRAGALGGRPRRGPLLPGTCVCDPPHPALCKTEPPHPSRRSPSPPAPTPKQARAVCCRRCCPR